MKSTTLTAILLLLLIALLPLSPIMGQATAETAVQETADQDAAAPDAAQPRSCTVIRIPLPVTLATAPEIRRSLQIIGDQAPNTTTAKNRPVVVLEFETDRNQTGTGSDWGACISLAQYLTSPAMSRVQTVAYISANDSSDKKIKGQLNGHAVLLAAACSEIVMEPATAIGNAGDAQDADWIVDAYKTIASQRYALPAEVVLSMLRPDRGLFRVTTPDAVLFTDEAQWKQLTKDPAVEATTLAPANKRALLTSEQLQEFRLIDHNINSKSDLARKLNLAPDQLTADASGGTWKAISIEVPEFLDQRTARWITRAIKPAVERHNANLLILNMNNSVGDLEAGVALSRAIAQLDGANLKTVAVIKQSARSGSALAALACDQLILHKDATIGGFEPANAPGEDRPHSVSDSHRNSYRDDVIAIAKSKDKDWSLLAAMIDAKIHLSRYRNPQTGETRLMSIEEWESEADAEQWEMVAGMDTLASIPAKQLKQYSIASNIIDDAAEIKSIYQLDDDPKSLAPTSSDRWIQSFAAVLTSPAVASMLIMGAFFFISTEMSAPGLGVPGFLGTLCLAGFFWSQHFDGNAEWFEILMFGIGISFILMEVFVIPGFGIFGIGGIIMVSLSIVLAAQSFLVPLNVRDMEKLPGSLFPLVGAGLGIVAAALIIPRILPDTPFFKNVILAPPKKPDFDLGDEDSEATAHYGHLLGQRGVAVTQLMPSGRAQFGEEICDVITRGQVVEKDAAVEVIEAVANRVVVKKV